MSKGNGFYTEEEIRKRLSVSTIIFWRHRPLCESALEEVARHGIKSIELLESPEQFDMAEARSMKIIGNACRACGIKIVAYHAYMMTFKDLDTVDKRTACVDRCRRQIDTMLELGATVWGSHATVPDATVFRCHEELARHVEGTKATITVENFAGGGCCVEDRMAFLDKLDHPQAGMILDIGHMRDHDGGNPMTRPGGPTAVLEMCGRRLRHVHLHGFKDGEDHFPPFVEGDTIRWVELFRMLHATGYPGVMNFEPLGEPLHDNVLEAVASAPGRLVEMAKCAQ